MVENKTAPWWHSVVSGNVAGVCGLTVAYPLDTVKCRLQTRPKEYGNAWGCLNAMLRKEGFLSLFRGLLSPVLGFGAINIAVFTTYTRTKYYLTGGEERPLSLGESLIAGSNAGFISSFVRAPVERVKTVMQVRNSGSVTTAAPYRNSFVCACELTRTHGLSKGLFRGTVPTILREIPQYGPYFFFYEWFKRKLGAWRGQDPENLSPFSKLLAGGITGALCWLPPTYCVDVVKTRLQSAPEGAFRGTWDCAKRCYAADGAPVFFRGMTVAMIRAFPLHGTILVVQDIVATMLRDLDR